MFTLYRRSGTLFEGWFKSTSLVQSERYLLACYRYIELNPVRARMVANPADYRWSSYRHHALGEEGPLITLHPEFAELGRTPAERQAAYQALVREAIPEEDIAAIRVHLNKDCALGSKGFQEEIATVTRRRAWIEGRGRPKKLAEEK